MDFVAPSLAVGSFAEAASQSYRLAHGIEAVLSLVEVDFRLGEQHATLPLRDGERLPAATVAAAVAFIDHQLRAGRKVLVHCQMGLSRSPAIAAAYLCACSGMRIGPALDWVCRQRVGAAPHPRLVESLYHLYAAPDIAVPPRAVDLSANENPLGPSPRALVALAEAAGRSHRYPDRQGSALRQALAARLAVEVGQVVLGNGSCELLDLIARALLAPGDQALIATPSFLPYQSAIRRAYGELVAVPLAADFTCDYPGMAERVGPRTRLVILGHPNNPTGVALAADALAHFLDRLPPDVVVVIDEAYRDYVDQPGAADALALVRAGRPVIALRTFSKLHALAGLRIGYAVAAPEVAARIEAVRPHYNTSGAAQAAALASLDDAAHAANSLAVNRSGLAELAAACGELGLAVVPSQANFLLVAVGDGGRVTDALAAHGVLVKSAAAFGLPAHIRISVGTPGCNRRCLEALRAVIDGRRGEQANNLSQGAQAW